ncbi:MAG: S8 family serine peptidase [Chitinophagales bacterium]
MKNWFLLSCLCAALFGNAQTALLSPRTKIFLNSFRNSDRTLPQGDFVYKQTTQGICLSALLQVSPSFNQAGLRQLNVQVGTKAGNILTAQIPPQSLKALTTLSGIRYIELDEPIGRLLDSVRKVTRVDSVHAGINLPMAYTGKDVVLGIIDIGFDFSHPAFYDSLGEHYRIKRIWMEKTPGTPPSGFSYGNELTDSAAMHQAHSDNIANSHGTHVAAIAGGSGRGSTNAKFRGMAYETDIVMVGILTDSSQWQNTGMSDMIDGMNYIFNYAASVGKPCVINLSWGSGVGPHDGSSLFAQACDALTGPGKIFVCAAGNIGDTKNHLQKTFAANDTVQQSFVNFASYAPQKRTWIDLWGQSGKNFCAQISLYNNGITASTGYVCLDNAVHKFNLIGTLGDTCFASVTTSNSEFNGKPRIYIGLYSKVTDSVLLTVRASDGEVHSFLGYVSNATNYISEFSSNQKTWAMDGNSDFTISDIANTNSAITVGAYASKISFKNIGSQTLSYASYATLHDIVPFSSHGPTVDGRVKPDITAPGMAVVSAVNSYDPSFLPSGGDYSSVVSSYFDSLMMRKRYYAALSGTSMASPACSGIVALLLQIKPNLTPAQIKNILAKTAIIDTFTGNLNTTGSNIWGHGKINAYGAAMMAQSIADGVPTLPAFAKVEIAPNPNQGTFRLYIEPESSETVNVDIYTVDGRLVRSEYWNINVGPNTKTFQIDNSHGLHFVKLTSNSRSFVKVLLVE